VTDVKTLPRLGAPDDLEDERRAEPSEADLDRLCDALVALALSAYRRKRARETEATGAGPAGRPKGDARQRRVGAA
jgi:hypothetical protein